MNRIDPKMPVTAYETFSVHQGADTGIRAACQDAGCAAYAHGWDTTVDESTALGAAQADYIRHRAGRTFREMKTAAGLTVFRFDAFQRCFAEHFTRPQRWGMRDGDHRGNPTGKKRVFDRPDQWVDAFATHQDKLADAAGRG